MRQLRYLVPNAFTAAGIAFAAVSIQRSVDGLPRSAAWWAMLCVLTDKADGFMARRLNASSEFGAQLDSFSDFFSFGVAPATLFYAFFSRAPGLGWDDPPHHVFLALLSFFYLLCVASRLARFNVTLDVQGSGKFFFGIPTTFVGGILCAFFAVCLKYSAPEFTANDPSSDHVMLLGSLRLDGVLGVFPWLLAPAGYAMMSALRVPKVGRTGSPIGDALQLIGLIGGYAAGMTRHLPEYLVAAALCYLFYSIYFHFTSREARAAKLPPIFGEANRPSSHSDERSARG